MPTKTIVAKYVDQPSKHPKYGAVKSAEGERFSVEKTILQQITQGGTYTVDYVVKDNGYMDIVGVRSDVPVAAANAGIQTAQKEKDDRIARLAIAKSIIETYPLPNMATLGNAELIKYGDLWWDWCNR